MGGNLAGTVETVVFQNSLIEYVHCHDTWPAQAGFGGGVQLKPGANSNIVRFSVFYNVGAGIILYDNFDRGTANRVYSNVVWEPKDNCYQATAGSEFANNLCFDAANNGIQIATNQRTCAAVCA